MSKDYAHSTFSTYETMIQFLKNYKQLRSRVLQLEYEIAESRPLVDEDEVIVSMALQEPPVGEGSVKITGTEHIALSYADKAKRINFTYKQELTDEYLILKKDKERLEYYLSLLDDRQEKVLRLLYFEGKTIAVTTEELEISQTTLKTTRRAGIQKLVDMYNSLHKTTNT
jgi:DNA-directed RNA polymerase specialized sigma24 family protein